jgi:hypothetical protein
MKRLPILFFAALCAVACEKPGAQNPTGQPYVIKGSGITAPVPGAAVRGTVEGYGTVAETKLTDGSFELTLPATLPEKALSSVATDDRTKGATASDPEARLAFLCLEFAGSLVAISLDDSHQADGNVTFGSRKALFIYADRPVTLTGESKWEQVAKSPLSEGEARHQIRYTDTWEDVSLNAGWNRVCAENSVVLGAEFYEVKNTISHKNLDDCQWNVVAPVPQE